MLDLQTYLDRLASADSTPGGGSATAIVGALGAALVAMVARITAAGEKHRAVAQAADALVSVADALRARFEAARPADEAAYAAVVAAQARPRSTPEERASRTAEIQAALALAAQTPLQLAGAAGELIAACEDAAALRNVHVMSDVACALAFGAAALSGAAANVRINHRFMHDVALVAEQAQRLAEIEARARTVRARLTAVDASG